MKIAAIGSIAFDSVLTPRGGADEVLGGSAIYFSVSASFFSETGIVGVVGDDFPDEYIAMLHGRNIDTSGVARAQGRTFRWKGRYLDNMNERETLSVCQNVFENFSPELPEKYRDAEFLFLGNISPAQQAEVLSQMRRPVLVAADTMDLWIEKEKSGLELLMGKIDMLMVNDSEAKLLTGEHNPVRAALKIHDFGPGIAVVKRGENGVIVSMNGHIIMSAPAFPLPEFSDPTGAGDAFAGAMIGSLASEGSISEKTLKRSAARGAVVASFCVEDFSLNRLLSARKADIEARFQEYGKITGF